MFIVVETEADEDTAVALVVVVGVKVVVAGETVVAGVIMEVALLEAGAAVVVIVGFCGPMTGLDSDNKVMRSAARPPGIISRGLSSRGVSDPPDIPSESEGTRLADRGVPSGVPRGVISGVRPGAPGRSGGVPDACPPAAVPFPEDEDVVDPVSPLAAIAPANKDVDSSEKADVPIWRMSASDEKFGDGCDPTPTSSVP